jgi:hypothetical protein
LAQEVEAFSEVSLSCSSRNIALGPILLEHAFVQTKALGHLLVDGNIDIFD